MGKKSGPSAPAAPDPVATANAQANANKQAAITQANLDRVNQYTPQGSSVYTKTGTNSDGTPIYNQTTTYSAAEQQKYDQANQVAIALGGLANNNISRVAQAQSTPFNYDKETPLQTAASSGDLKLQTGPQTANPVQTSIADPGAIERAQQGAGGAIDQQAYGAGGAITQAQQGAAGNVQSGLDYSKLSALPGTNDFSADAQRVAGSVYNQAASRLNPQWDQSASKLQSQLAAQGISANSGAYNRAMQNYSMAKNDAYNQANFSATQAGGAEQSRLFGLALGARQQGQNEVNTQGDYANAAQNQAYNQYMGTIGQQNQAQAQAYGQNLSTTEQRNAAQQQTYQQYMDTINQRNQAQGQTYDQSMGQANLANTANAQNFSQQQAIAALNNTAQNTAFNQSAANVALNNQARSQQIQEQTYLRNMPLNDIASLLGTGPGVQQPNFQNVAQVGVAAPDYQGIVQNNYNQAVSQYNTQQQAQAQMLGSIFGAAGTIGAAFVPSDERLKRDIKHIGVLANGIRTYAFKYIGSKMQEFGVMAQEVFKVLPEAVSTMPNGYLAVDYGKVFS